MGRGNTEICAAPWDASTQRTARQHGTRHTENCAAAWDAAPGRTARHYGARKYESARHHRRAATVTRGSIHERGTIANIDVNEAATNETIRVAAIHKKYTFVTDGTDVTVQRIAYSARFLRLASDNVHLHLSLSRT